MMKLSKALAVAVVAIGGAARADSSEAFVQQSWDPSPSMALALSGGLTLGGIATGVGMFMAGDRYHSNTLAGAGVLIASAAFVVGPSTGHIYSGEGGHAVRFSLYRAGLGGLGVGAIAAGIGIGVGCAMGGIMGGGDESSDDCDDAAGPLVVVGGILSAGALSLAVYDIIDAPRSARRMRARNVTTVSLGPMVTPRGDYMVGVAGRF